MVIEKCFECRFPTKDRWPVIPEGRLLPLCRLCQAKIPRVRNPFEHIMDGDGSLNAKPSKPRTNYKLTPEMLNRAMALRKGGSGYSAIAKDLGLSVATVYSAIRKALKFQE